MKVDVGDLNKQLIELLIEKKLTVSSAESCTGGLISALLTDIPGASEVLNECIVTYSNDAKMRQLGVKAETLSACGAVSFDTAEQMAAGICARTGADVGIAVTGIAGPGGGTEKKPVGTVFIGISVKGKISVFENHFDNISRSKVRESTCNEALSKTIELIKSIA